MQPLPVPTSITPRVLLSRHPLNGDLNKELRFRSGNQYGIAHQKINAVELPVADQVGKRLTRTPPVCKSAQVSGRIAVKLALQAGKEICASDAQDVAQQHLGL